jgi:hypothetical protein
MTNRDPRTQERRSSSRRNKERRANHYPFGSEQWLSRIRSEYMLAPKRERRQVDRRNEDRRNNKRRNPVKSTSPTNRFAWPNLLSDDERKMLNDLMQDQSES